MAMAEAMRNGEAPVLLQKLQPLPPQREMERKRGSAGGRRPGRGSNPPPLSSAVWDAVLPQASHPQHLPVHPPRAAVAPRQQQQQQQQPDASLLLGAPWLSFALGSGVAGTSAPLLAEAPQPLPPPFQPPPQGAALALSDLLPAAQPPQKLRPAARAATVASAALQGLVPKRSAPPLQQTAAQRGGRGTVEQPRALTQPVGEALEPPEADDARAPPPPPQQPALPIGAPATALAPPATPRVFATPIRQPQLPLLAGEGTEEEKAGLLRAALRSSANAANSAFSKRAVIVSPGEDEH